MGTRGIPNFYGGFEQLAEHLAPGLVRAGHDVTVYNSHNHPFQGDEWEGVRIIHCYDPEYILGSAGQFVYDLNCLLDARKRNFDVILQLGYTSSSVWGALFPPGAMVIYNMDGLEWQRSKYSRIARRFLLYAEKLAVKYSDFYVTDSPVIQSYFRDKYGIWSEYIAYGADLFPSADESVLKEYKVIPGDYYLLMARMEAENNIGTILDGFSRSDTKRKILVVGNIANKFGREIKARFDNDQRIIFTGGIYAQPTIHALKFHSRMYFHGHSTGGTNPSLLEAMASRALIAAHDNAFNREVLGGDALYFSSAAEITHLVDNTPSGEREMIMTRNNREKILRRFNWPEIIMKYEKFIGQSLAIHKKTDPVFMQRYGNKNTLPPMETGTTGHTGTAGHTGANGHVGSNGHTGIFHPDHRRRV
jgi:glycosyltransferase involved in cell wall biosynthesis